MLAHVDGYLRQKTEKFITRMRHRTGARDLTRRKFLSFSISGDVNSVAFPGGLRHDFRNPVFENWDLQGRCPPHSYPTQGPPSSAYSWRFRPRPGLVLHTLSLFFASVPLCEWGPPELMRSPHLYPTQGVPSSGCPGVVLHTTLSLFPFFEPCLHAATVSLIDRKP